MHNQQLYTKQLLTGCAIMHLYQSSKMPTHLYIHKYINAKYSVWNRAGRDSYCSVLLRFSAAILINMSE